MPTFLSCEADTVVGAETVQQLADEMLELLGYENAELSVVLTTDEEIRKLNAEHRQLDEATDVLAFPMDFAEGEGDSTRGDDPTCPGVGAELLGDVVISIPTAARQATRAGHSLAVEVRFLLAHGLLHLVGYDHQDADEKVEMDAATVQLVAETEKK